MKRSPLTQGKIALVRNSDFRQCRNTAPLLPQMRKWVQVQEGAIEQVRVLAAKALEAGNLSQCLLAWQLVTRMQSELIALFAPNKAPAKSTETAETETAEPDAEEEELPDLSKMSDEEIERLARDPEAAPAPLAPPRKPLSRPRGRSKGCEASGAAKIAKERAQERRVREQREREAGTHDPHISSLASIPSDWRD
jgi:hypothetical protein